MIATTLTADPSGPLSPAQQSQIAAAKERARKIRQAAKVAGFNGWVTSIFAICSAPFALFSLPGFLVTVGLSVVAYNEFRGRRRLLQFDGEAPRLLGWNQVGFLVMIILYCTWMLFTGLSGEGPFAAELKAKPELADVFGSVDDFDRIYRMAVVAIYGTTIVLSVIFQGLNASYYFTRRKHIVDYLKETPDWVLNLQRLTTSA